MLRFVDRKTKETVAQHDRILMGHYDTLANRTVPGIVKTVEDTHTLVKSLTLRQDRAFAWVQRAVALAVLGVLLDKLGMLSPAVRALLAHLG
jgi:hypothetical protein